MNYATKKTVLLALICLYQAPCAARVTDAVFINRVVFRAIPAALLVGGGVGKLIYSANVNVSNAQFKARIEAKAENQPLHYASQAATGPNAETAQKNLNALIHASALAKEVARANDDEITAIKKREAYINSLIGGIALGCLTLAVGMQVSIN